jgi:hypothetical protein
MRGLLFGVFVLAAAVAHADESHTLFSRTFGFRGRCNGGDMVYSWKVDGGPAGSGHPLAKGQFGPSFIYPWLDQPIAIRGVEVINTGPAGLAGYLFGPAYFGLLLVGNNASGDIMVSMGASGTRASNMFPHDMAFAFPARSATTPLTYIDLHATCRWPHAAQILLTLYYSLEPPPHPQVAGAAE